jgi:signal transduction histidine kinase
MEQKPDQIIVNENLAKDGGESLLVNPQLQHQQIYEILVAESKKDKEEFMAMARHELKTPITSIKVYTQILHEILQEKGDQYSSRIILKMDEHIDKLIRLIEDMLDTTRINEGKLILKREDYDMNQLIEEVVEEIQPTTKRHAIETKLEHADLIFGDKEKTSQVLLNLLSNAIKYSPNSEKIIVRSSATEKKITVCVQDFGIGVSKEMQKNLFKRFFRVIDESTKTFPGLGFGLFIATEIIQQHNGRIWVESVPKVGSSFYFCLPYC